ncbi:SIR2 family protein [Acidithiobacillus ferriphilus]|uniref:SIR2 family NAD-dependent protein deacylase n=1 Tax=Acidithiobacillus ferriphilus TaxID=1689834 RepID=UPI002DBBE044|nr:SIR2 family protein [Acidithiobacillus ferriphilus]MEB8475327.1 SIR2 family protein [Acidithiobacillus ferriphilus]
MATIPTIRDLSDYPAIKKLASALHHLDASHHGAAIMIGSGFSRSAARHVGGQKKMRLWAEFTKSLARELGADKQDLSFADPLRVAEEYRAYFGQAALNDRIRFEIENEAWRTGPLYETLLELPWSEVLTTNWDTLLEQAADKIHSPYYTPVTKTSDLAWAQSPRIVKLHGTIGVTETFIAAQEDYRTYPERFAPFVNLARQVFIENELCLLGFSGDDPNFLQWAGWVRDHLASHARKIYLVGALNLSAARRKQLESINVAPVDLWQAVAHISDSDLRHETAIDMFLKAMRDEEKSRPKPHEWQPTFLASNSVTIEDPTRTLNDPTYGASLLVGQLQTLRQDRESYPGWVVCPTSLRWRLAHQISTPYPNPTNLAALTPDDRERLLYEIAWRHSITFEYIHPWLSDILFDVAKLDQPCALSKRQQLEIAVMLLHNTRLLQTDNEGGQRVIEEYTSAVIGILEKDVSYLPECATEIAYYRALEARDQLDYDGLTAAVGSIVGVDPIWMLRKAALLMELGRSEEAIELVAQAYGNLRENHRRDRQSIPILSRLLWAHWLLSASQRASGQKIEELPTFAENNYRKWECDPWSWMDDLRYKIDEHREKYLKRKRRIEPQFGQGHYRDRSSDISFNNDIPGFLLFDGLSRTIGIPLHSGGSPFGLNLLASTAEKIVLSGGTGVDLWDSSLAIRSATSDSSAAIIGLFTRIGVARASLSTVDVLVQRILSAVTYWMRERTRGTKDCQGEAISRLRVFLEVLARLAVRVSPAQAKEIFSLAASFGRQPEVRHLWLYEVLGNLLTHSLMSIPESEQGGLLPTALEFPLPREIVGGDDYRWPNPVITHPNARDSYSDIDAHIVHLIEAVASSNGESRRAPLLRLLPLAARDDFFTQQERENLATAIWGESPGYQVIPQTGLLPHALLLLPVMDVRSAEALVRAHLYDHGADILEDTQKEMHSYPSPEIQRAISIYDGIANAAANETTLLFPSAEQACVLFDRLTLWRPPEEKAAGFFEFERGSRKRLAVSIGRALSYAIVPALADDAKTDSRLGQLEAFYSGVEGAQTALPAFVYFSSVNEESVKAIAKVIQAALRSRDSTLVDYSTIALRKWMDLPESSESANFKNLISLVITIIESGRTIGLQQLIWLAGQLHNGRRLSEDQQRILVEVLPTVFGAADYANIDPNSPEAVSASTIRAECVRLAQTLQHQFSNEPGLIELVTKAQADPLPEVRFAVNSVQ